MERLGFVGDLYRLVARAHDIECLYFRSYFLSHLIPVLFDIKEEMIGKTGCTFRPFLLIRKGS